MKISYVYSNFPSYRIDFLNSLSYQLGQEGILFNFLYGSDIFKKEIGLIEGVACNHKMFTSERVKFLSRFVKNKGLFKYFKEEKFDACIISYVPTNLSMLRIVWYCLLNGIPYATWRCGYNSPNYNVLSSFLRKRIINFVEKKATINITYGSAYKNELVARGINCKKIVVAQNTINVEKILSCNDVGFEKFNDNQISVLFVGAIISGKLLQSSIDAVIKLHLSGYNVIFNIIGGGEQYDFLNNYVISNNASDYIKLLGKKYNQELSYPRFK